MRLHHKGFILLLLIVSPTSRAQDVNASSGAGPAGGE
jgi:hypothetical protein